MNTPLAQAIYPPEMETFSDHWTGISQIWKEIGSPLRPSPEDLEYVAAAIARFAPKAMMARGLVLGSTPEFHRILQRENIRAIASDLNSSMLREIWPGAGRTRMMGNWTALPFANATFGVALCDAGMIHLRFPDDLIRFGFELRRILRPEGVFVSRLLVPPLELESPDQVAEDLLAGRIPNLNQLKLRLGIALQSSPEIGVRLSDVWNFIHALDTDMSALAARIGWDAENLFALRTYRDSPARYYFISRETFESVMAHQCGMKVCASHDPTYEMGNQCPTLVMKSLA